MALYEVDLLGNYFGQKVVNRWNFLSDNAVGFSNPSFNLAKALGFILSGSPLAPPSASWFRHLLDCVSGNLENVEVLVKNVYDPTDFYDAQFSPAIIGLDQATNGDSPFAAFGFFTNRTRLDVRRGQKRLAGVPEGAATSGGVIVSGKLTTLNIFAADMSADVSDTVGSDTIVFSPVVVQKEKYTVPGSSPARSAYRYYASPTVQIDDHLMTGVTWTPYPQLRTQVSRQYGRGQ